MKLMCIGQSAYDITLPLDHYPIENKKVRIPFKVECGGSASNCAYLLAKWNVETYFAGVIGVDRVNGNMSFSIVWYNKLNSKFYRVSDILLRKKDEYGRITDISFPKYGNTQLICKNWGNDDLKLPSCVEEEITNLKHR